MGCFFVFNIMKDQSISVKKARRYLTKGENNLLTDADIENIVCLLQDIAEILIQDKSP